jgi:hypothetical protein
MMDRFAHQGEWSDEDWDRAVKRNKEFRIADYEWLAANCSKCKEVGAEVSNNIDLKYEGKELFGTQIAGVTANMGEIENKTIINGRFIAPHEVEHSSPVAVIGGEVRTKFFEGIDPIGNPENRNMPVTIVGVEEMAAIPGQSIDNHIYIPITTFGKWGATGIFSSRQRYTKEH